MAEFEISYRITKANEGGYHSGGGDNAHDAGGETFKGIARKMHPHWPGWKLVDLLKPKVGFPTSALNSIDIQKMVLDFYKRAFWDVNRLDDIQSQPIANEVFDTGVNMGTNAAAKMLQRGVNYLNRDQRNYRDIAVDGDIGPVTLDTVNALGNADTLYLFNLLNIMQGCVYLDIMDRNKTQEVFIRGWLHRIEMMKL